MENVVEQMRHAKERLYGRLTMIIGIVLWAIFAAALVFEVINGNYISLVAVIVYALIFWVFFIVGHLLLRAYIYGHYVLIGPDQSPHIHQMVVEGAAASKSGGAAENLRLQLERDDQRLRACA